MRRETTKKYDERDWKRELMHMREREKEREVKREVGGKSGCLCVCERA